MTSTKKFLWNYAIGWGFLYQSNPKNLDLSYKTDLDFGIVLEGENPILWPKKYSVTKVS